MSREEMFEEEMSRAEMSGEEMSREEMSREEMSGEKMGRGRDGSEKCPTNIFHMDAGIESIWSTLRFLCGSTPEDCGISYEKFV
jgi:succinate dehydrogenase/fumarate reductase flavoprotein subunit